MASSYNHSSCDRSLRGGASRSAAPTRSLYPPNIEQEWTRYSKKAKPVTIHNNCTTPAKYYDVQNIIQRHRSLSSFFFFLVTIHEVTWHRGEGRAERAQCLSVSVSQVQHYNRRERCVDIWRMEDGQEKHWGVGGGGGGDSRKPVLNRKPLLCLGVEVNASKPQLSRSTS